ncbi:hypothetical protein Tco_0383147 [Tanacetum coccineum]
MGDTNPIRSLGDYSKPSHEGYKNTIELLVGNNVVPFRSNTIRLVQNGCSFHRLRSEDPNQHLKDFLKLMDSLDLDDENRERTRLRLFQFSLRDQASNWFERLPAGSITTWEDLTTRNKRYVMDFTILKSIETNIDPSLSNVVFGRPFVETACLATNRKYGLMTFTYGIKEITFKTRYKDPERSELSREGHDLLSSMVILSENDYDRGCRRPSDLEDEFYRDTIKLGPEYLTGIDDGGEVT